MRGCSRANRIPPAIFVGLERNRVGGYSDLVDLRPSPGPKAVQIVQLGKDPLAIWSQGARHR